MFDSQITPDDLRQAAEDLRSLRQSMAALPTETVEEQNDQAIWCRAMEFGVRALECQATLLTALSKES